MLGTNIVTMSASALPGSTLVAQVADPVSGGTLYTIYTDPNGLTVNVPTNFGIAVYQDVKGNPVQYFDGKTYHSLQADYVASPDGTVMYYVQPLSNGMTLFGCAGRPTPGPVVGIVPALKPDCVGEASTTLASMSLAGLYAGRSMSLPGTGSPMPVPAPARPSP